MIDPIDGTTNFLHGIPHFCISIGLKFKDEIISGIIFDPIKNEIFYAEKNQGAFLIITEFVSQTEKILMNVYLQLTKMVYHLQI